MRQNRLHALNSAQPSEEIIAKSNNTTVIRKFTEMLEGREDINGIKGRIKGAQPPIATESLLIGVKLCV